MSSRIVISKLFACACNITVKQYNLNAKVTLFNPSMFYRFECHTFVTRCRCHTKGKQEVTNFLLRGRPIINIRYLVAKGDIYRIKAQNSCVFCNLSSSFAKSGKCNMASSSVTIPIWRRARLLFQHGVGLWRSRSGRLITSSVYA